MFKDLQKLRSEIDRADKVLIAVLAKRFEITKKIGQRKKQHNLPMQDEQREQEMLKQRKLWAKESGIEPDLVVGMFQTILKKVVQDNEKK